MGNKISILFTKNHIITNAPIEVLKYDDESGEQERFYFKLPTVQNVLFDSFFAKFFHIIEEGFEQIKKQINIPDVYTLFLFCIKKASSDPILKECLMILMYVFKKIGIEIEIKNYALYFKEFDMIMVKKDFDKIIDIILLAAAIKKDSEVFLTEEEKKYQDKINKIRKNAENNKESASLDDVIITLRYYFNYSPEEILKMPYANIVFLLSYIGKITEHEVTKIAAGNGLTKKITPITKRRNNG